MMHSMDWLRRVIIDHYDKLLRDKNRDQHHQSVRRGVPGLWKHGGKGPDPKPSAPAPKKGARNPTPSGGSRAQSAAPATRKGRCPEVPKNHCSPWWISGCCPRDHKCKNLIHARPNCKPRGQSNTAAATPSGWSFWPRLPAFLQRTQELAQLQRGLPGLPAILQRLERVPQLQGLTPSLQERRQPQLQGL